MTAVFADSFYFFAILNPRDEAHAAATSLHKALRAPLVTTLWVLTGIADGLAHTPSRHLFRTLLERLRSDSRMTIVPATDELFERGLQMYHARLDKQWSLTDCISFAVMAENGLTDVLTGDHHFEQAGFRALLKGER